MAEWLICRDFMLPFPNESWVEKHCSGAEPEQLGTSWTFPKSGELYDGQILSFRESNTHLDSH